MKYAFPFLLLLICLGASLGTSCDREGLDDLVITNEPNGVDTTFCGVSFELLSIDSSVGALLYTDLPAMSPIYTYEWNDGSSAESLLVDTLGTYSLTVTDALGCSAEGQLIIDEFPCTMLAVEIFIKDSLIDYKLSTIITNGQAPYDHLWSEGSVDDTIVVVAPGTYSVTVMDTNGCIGTNMINL